MKSTGFPFVVFFTFMLTRAFAGDVAVPLGIDALPNAHRVAHRDLLVGGQPNGDEGFAALEKLGVQTVISVDGAQPDIEAAKRHGLRYVHLPHGYDSVDDERIRELAKAITDLPGPIYIHCHHGKHRSPAAAAAACVAAGWITNEQAGQILTLAGTGLEYRGLYRSVETAQRLNAADLKSWKFDFQEIAPIPAMASMMVDLEHTFDRLKSLQSNTWVTLESDPDGTPAHEALLLREHFSEVLRSEDMKSRPAQFRELLAHSLDLSKRLELLIGETPADASAMNLVLKEIGADCKSCHHAHRD